MPRPRQTSLFLRAVSRRSLCHRLLVRREPIPLSTEPLPRIKPQFRAFTSTRMAVAAPRRDLPAWSPPTTTSERPLPPLTIYNTFTRKKEPFVPLDKSGKKVTWYCCGPTVYDAAHLGHARNYVTTDVVRRIMRDYFGFDVHFVQNVTDVDDKIILRARQKFLLDEYSTKNPKLTSEVQEDAKKAWQAYFNKQFVPKDNDGNVLDAEAAMVDLSSFEKWAAAKHGELVMLIQKEAARKASSSEEPEDDVILDEAATKKKMHLNTLLTAREAIEKPPTSAEDFYAATASILLPYLDALNKGREYPHEVFSKLSSYWEKHFDEDMAILNVLPPNTVTRVSEFIPENIDFVKKLVEKGFAYPTRDGSVYFDIAAYESAGHTYAKLQPWSRGNEGLIADGEGALTSKKASTLPNTLANNDWPVEKKAAQDFALWKASKPGEPSWESPWGFGRPGWHIECSVMCSEVLGGEVDIHSGGIDLAFPHHDNEIAQSEAYWDGCSSRHTIDGKHQWINYFLHMGHLQIHGSKMSKSLKNFVSVRDALQRGGWTSRSLRIVFLLGSWKDGIEVRQGVLDEAKNWEQITTKFFTNVKALLAEQDTLAGTSDKIAPQPWGKKEHTLQKAYDQAREEVDKALCDSFDTPTAMKSILNLISAANIYLSPSPPGLALPREVARWISRIISIFGIDTPADHIGFHTPTTSSSSDTQDIALPFVRALSSFRDSIRTLAISAPAESKPLAQQLLQLCDKLRNQDMVDLGVALDDRDSGAALIKFVPAEELRAQRDEKERKQREKDEKKEAERKKREELARKKEEAAKLKPEEMFRGLEEWIGEKVEWDENGIPTKDKEGNEVTKSKRKNLVKLWEKQKKAHEEWKKSKGLA